MSAPRETASAPFAGKRVLVTGGADGIGLALAEAFGAAGATLFVSDIAADRLARHASRLAAASAVCDVTDADAVADLVDRAWREVGPLDLLCANAGVVVPGSILDATPDDLAFQFDVNVWGVRNAVRPFVERLREARRPGHILMTGSETSLSYPWFLKEMPTAAYSMSKHAVLAMGDALRGELARDGIAVSVLCPGPVATQLGRNSGELRRDRLAGSPAPRLSPVSGEVGEFLAAATRTPAEVAALALEGLRRGLFVIPTHPHIRRDTAARFDEIERGLAFVDEMDRRDRLSGVAREDES